MLLASASVICNAVLLLESEREPILGHLGLQGLASFIWQAAQPVPLTAHCSRHSLTCCPLCMAARRRRMSVGSDWRIANCMM